MPAPSLSQHTQLCISLAARPSAIGTRFHNYLYAELGLDFVYKACTTTDLPAAIAGIRALGIRGCGVSMPFKEDTIALVDELDASASAIGAVNTIVNTDGWLRAYNTDYLAVAALLPAAPTSYAVAGAGGMARAAVAALRDGGFGPGLVVARDEPGGRALATAYGATWVPRLGDARPALLVNATPIGMAPDEGLAFPAEAVRAAAAVLDVVAVPPETPLVRLARAEGVPVRTGAEVIARQAAEQFFRYTGVRPTDEQVSRASEWSRSG